MIRKCDCVDLKIEFPLIATSVAQLQIARALIIPRLSHCLEQQVLMNLMTHFWMAAGSGVDM